MFTSVEEFFEYLHSHSQFSINLGLERVERACELLGNPHLKLKTIHVAGTNGKGSTCNYLMHLLKNSGFKVGLYVSPYIEVFNERIQINGEYISDAELIAIANQLLPVIERVERERQETLTEFEIITLLSFIYFYDQDVDFAIYEVGLGGRYDATNVIAPIVAGITNISLDHTNILGDTISKIAYEKIGIAKPGLKLFTTEAQEEALEVFRHFQEEVPYTLIHLQVDRFVTGVELLEDGVEFTYLPLNERIMLPLFGHHQVNNAVLALQMYEEIMTREEKERSVKVIQRAFRQAKWPGRIDVISKDPLIIIDGSHNEAGVQRLVEAMDYYLGKGYKIHTVFSALKDKDTNTMIQCLESISTSICFTTFPFPRASTAKALAQNSQHPNVTIEEDFKVAIEGIKNRLKSNELLLITGSLYFISQVKHFLRVNEVLK